MSYQKKIQKNKSVYLCSPFNRIYDTTGPLYADKQFIKLINTTPRLYSDKEIKDYIESENFDAFIVGSDQVWREEYSPSIKNFFLDFLEPNDNRKKIAYAASFGKRNDYISEKNFSYCKGLIKKFDAISVREKSGLEILKDDFNIQTGIKVLDPTLLLSKEDYLKIIKPKDLRFKNNLVTYILDKNEKKINIINKIANENHYDIHEINANYNGYKMHSISEWLGAFASAKFIITDSFHGCVFSIIFNKPFIVISNNDRGLDRFISLLSDFRLLGNMFSEEDVDIILSQIQSLQIVSYDSSIMQDLRKESYAFLNNNLTNE